MILREQLLKLNGNVKIGVKSGFVYCHVIDEDTIDTLVGISYDYKNRFKRNLADVRDYLKRFDEIWKNELRKRTELLLLDGVKPSAKEKQEVKDEWQKDKDKSFKEATNKEKVISEFLENWKPIPEREVKEIYDTIDTSEPKGTKIILVGGLENGNYWITNEYKE